MARPPGAPVILRLHIADPVPGVMYSLCNDKNEAVAPRLATGASLTFDIPVTVKDGKFTGPFVRREGAVRRFVYIAMGLMAGDASAGFQRRAKIDVHDISPTLLAQGIAGKILEADLPGRDKKGDPACATVRPLGPWRAT